MGCTSGVVWPHDSFCFKSSFGRRFDFCACPTARCLFSLANLSACTLGNASFFCSCPFALLTSYSFSVLPNYCSCFLPSILDFFMTNCALPQTLCSGEPFQDLPESTEAAFVARTIREDAIPGILPPEERAPAVTAPIARADRCCCYNEEAFRYESFKSSDFFVGVAFNIWFILANISARKTSGTGTDLSSATP